MTDSPVVLFDTLPTADGKRFGVATLNSPASLNSLSVDMVRLLTPQLREWAQDASVAGVLLQAAGEKAFCAGGDLRQLYQTLLDRRDQRNEYAERFFGEEYELDDLIHNFPKPFLCWGHGIVMGGGVGLMLGVGRVGAILSPLFIGAIVGMELPLQSNFLAIAAPAVEAAISILLVQHQRSDLVRNRRPALA